MDITNKALALILVVATAISLFGVVVMINAADNMERQYVFLGMAPTDTSTANFSINSSLSVVFTTANANFGAGVINKTGLHNCTMNTSVVLGIPTVDCIGFNDGVPGLVLQNQGTQNVSLNVTFNATAAEFIGGTSPSLTYVFSENESTSCAGLTTTMTEVPGSGNQSICADTRFDWESGSRTLNLDIGMRIPENADAGTRTLLITAYASNP